MYHLAPYVGTVIAKAMSIPVVVICGYVIAHAWIFPAAARQAP